MTNVEQFLKEGRDADQKALRRSIEELTEIIKRLNRRDFLQEANRVGDLRNILECRLEGLLAK